MKRTHPILTKEMCERLRKLRLRKGLSQSELARRMGLGYRSGKSFVSLLEKGKIPDPHLSTITFYLRACGALFSEFYDVLTRVELLPIDPTPIQQTKLSLKRKERAVEQVTKQVQKYQARIEYPLVAVPMKPEKQWKATEAYREYAI
jgi:transcriptional regulator with XRE-family HTH domain